MEHKSFSLGEFKALGDDDANGTFEAVAAVFGNVDHGGDRIMRGAFKRSLGEWRRKGRSVPVLWSHDAEQVPIGVVKDAEETREGLRVKAQLLVDDHPQARAVYAAMKAGALHEFSFGYGVRDKATVVEHGKEIRVLKDLDLAEISPVFRGMNPATRLMGVKSADDEAKRLEEERAELQERLAENQRRILELTTQGQKIVEAVTAAVSGEIGGQIAVEQQQEQDDKPEPNAQEAEEAAARIRALQITQPMHLE